MSQNPQYPAHVVEDDLFQRTHEALVAFTGEDNVSLEQVDPVLLGILCEGKAYDPATFAGVLCLPHFRDFADVSDFASGLPAPVLSVLHDQHALDPDANTVENIIKLTCSKEVAIAHIRLAQHVQRLRDARASIVNDNDQISLFNFGVMTRALLEKITDHQMWQYTSPDLLIVLTDEARNVCGEMRGLDDDLFSDLPQQISSLGKTIDSIEPQLHQARQEREVGIAAAEALAQRRITHPEEFVFPRPNSAYEQLKTVSRQRFRL